jgi:hypothetical protein
VDVTWKQFAVVMEWLGPAADVLVEASLGAGLAEQIGGIHALVGDDQTARDALFRTHERERPCKTHTS